jgi:hypothetical protein
MMSSGNLPRSLHEIASAHPEVEFALVLARTIESAKSDPEQMRGAIYELARHKLQQLSHDNPTEKARLMQALDVAIAGVENHMKGGVIEKLPVLHLPGSHSELVPAPLVWNEPTQPQGRSRYNWAIDDDKLTTRRLRWASTATLRFCAILALFVTIAGIAVAQRRGAEFGSFGAAVTQLWTSPKVEPFKVADPDKPAAEASVPPKSNMLLPTAYGVYAESGGKLYELTMLQGRAPDPRVAISAAITSRSATILPDGHVKFKVFRAGADNGASGLIEVRLIARVKRGTTFDNSGKPVVAAADETWVIRNISMPYRAAPIKDEPQMYEVQPREPDAALTAGRYALVVRGQAFDFMIDGRVTDKQHCLERLAAANGIFYSECKDL